MTLDLTSAYDALAPVYDARYDTPEGHAEDAEVASWIKPYLSAGARILDVGCGTGLLIDLLGDYIDPGLYTGIDPSQGMLGEFRRKHPTYARRLVPLSLEDYLLSPPVAEFDLVLGLFGSPTYPAPEAIRELVPRMAPGGRGLFMPYLEGYLPDFEAYVDRNATRAAIRLLPGAVTRVWHNFEVVTFHG